MSYAAFPNARFGADDDASGTMLVGPSRDGRALEVALHGYYEGEELMVFHANYATQRILDRLQGKGK